MLRLRSLVAAVKVLALVFADSLLLGVRGRYTRSSNSRSESSIILFIKGVKEDGKELG